MTQPHDNPLLAKVRKLLAKAENDAATPAEAEAYTAKATQLMATYGIDQAMVADRDPARDPVADRVVDLVAPYAADKADLLAEVAGSLRCRAVLRRRGGERSVHVFGHRSDLERVELLFTSLLLQATTWLGRTPVPAREHVAAFRRSWLAGFRIAVVRRLREAERAAEQAAEAATHGPAAGVRRDTGLVLADRSARVADAVSQEYPRLRTAPERRLSGSGMTDGWAAGQRADLGGTRLAGMPSGMLGTVPT